MLRAVINRSGITHGDCQGGRGESDMAAGHVWARTRAAKREFRMALTLLMIFPELLIIVIVSNGIVATPPAREIRGTDDSW